MPKSNSELAQLGIYYYCVKDLSEIEQIEYLSLSKKATKTFAGLPRWH